MDIDAGRRFIILAAALILVAATLQMYIDKQNENPRGVETVAEQNAACDKDSIQLRLSRIGCQQQNGVTVGSISNQGGAKVISLARRQP